MKKRKKIKVIYPEDKGQTIYSMSQLNGRTPEEQEEFDKRRKSTPIFTGKEKWAMIKAAFTVYGPVLLIAVSAFAIAAILIYFWLH